CRLAKKSKAKVYVLHVIKVERALPLEATIEGQQQKAEEIMEHAERVAEEDGDYEVETELVQARETGPAIVDESIERNIDLIVIGATVKSRFGQHSLGTTLPYVLRSAPCRVIVTREPIGDGGEASVKTLENKQEPRLNGNHKSHVLPK
ncbi:MAG: universal stress protein, partial [Dehalococcoidia bacterium]|nr:universal stress protein [Dehalococcoidia bacterium]